jgi:hypothetical protein
MFARKCKPFVAAGGGGLEYIAASVGAVPGSGGTLTLDIPTGTQDGDVLIWFIGTRSSTTISGTWTNLIASAFDTRGVLRIAYRIWSTGDDTSYTCTDGSSGGYVCMVAVRGAGTPSIGTANEETADNSDFEIDCLSVSPSSSALLFSVCCPAHTSGTPMTPPSGQTEIADNYGGTGPTTTLGCALGVAYEEVSSGATGNKTYTHSAITSDVLAVNVWVEAA